jgi:hypothetical protein
MLCGAGTEHDDGHDEAGVEQQTRSAGEHRDSIDERGLLVCTEALAAAGGEKDAGDAVHVGWGAHTGNGSRPCAAQVK